MRKDGTEMEEKTRRASKYLKRGRIRKYIPMEMKMETLNASYYHKPRRIRKYIPTEMEMETRKASNYHKRRRIRKHISMEMEMLKASKYFYRRKYIPMEMWVEILSRLPIKSLVICRVVSKSWNYIVWYLTYKKIIDVPICGFLIREEDRLNYFCYKSKQAMVIQSNSSIGEYIIDSGYDKGPLSNSSFDLGALYKINPSNPNNQGRLFNFHGGLLLLGLYDGTYEVHNVATKEVFTVPKSSFVKNMAKRVATTELTRHGAIIEHSSNSTRFFHFIVVTFYPKYGICEVYHSRYAVWRTIRIMDYNIGDPRRWDTESSVALFQGDALNLYFLTNRDHGVALHILSDKSNKPYSTFPLPKLVHGEVKFSRTRLLECDSTLHISYYDVDGMWLWKLHWGCGSIDNVENWDWVPQLVISSSTLKLSTVNLTKTNAQRYLAKAIDAGHRVMPLTCQPDAAVIFILVNSTIYAYNLANDMLEKISETKDYNNICGVYLFKPCFRSLFLAKHGNLATELDI